MSQVTIKDIAREAGVSVATVSRVVNNSAPVNPQRREKILSAIQKYNYVPNVIARSLKVDSTKTIAMLIADETNEYFGQITKAVEAVIREKGYTLFVCNSLNDKDTELNYLRLLAERKVDGIIINASNFNNDDIVQMSRGLPTVLLHRKIQNPAFLGDWLDADFGESCYHLTLELIKAGHRKIGIICGPHSLSTAEDRYVNFRRAMKTVSVEVDDSYPYAVECAFTVEDGYRAAGELVSRADPPTALVIMHCETTIGSLRYFIDHGISVPRDISFVSPCNITLADLLYVKPCYSVVNTSALGRRAGELVLERIACRELPNREVMFSTNLMLGDSVGPVK